MVHRHFWGLSLNSHSFCLFNWRLFFFFLNLWAIYLEIQSHKERKSLFCGTTEDRRSINMGIRLVPSISEPPCCPGREALSGLCPSLCRRRRSTGGVPARVHCASPKNQQGRRKSKPRCQDHGSTQRDEATPVNARKLSAKTSLQLRRVACDWSQISVRAS